MPSLEAQRDAHTVRKVSSGFPCSIASCCSCFLFWDFLFYNAFRILGAPLKDGSLSIKTRNEGSCQTEHFQPNTGLIVLFCTCCVFLNTLHGLCKSCGVLVLQGITGARGTEDWVVQCLNLPPAVKITCLTTFFEA